MLGESTLYIKLFVFLSPLLYFLSICDSLKLWLRDTNASLSINSKQLCTLIYDQLLLAYSEQSQLDHIYNGEDVSIGCEN